MAYQKDGVHAFVWLKVGYAVGRKGQGVLGSRKELPARALHLGAPPPGVQRFSVVHRWHTWWNPDRAW